MTPNPRSDRSLADVEAEVESAIEEHDVVLFMKGTKLMPQCGYSRKALALIDRHRSEFETVDVMSALPAYRSALEAHSGWETIPQTFVEGEFVGGSDILEELEERGELAETLGGETRAEE